MLKEFRIWLVSMGMFIVLVGGILLLIWEAPQQSRDIKEGKSPPTFLSPTECIGADGKPAHGTYRWAVKVDRQEPPPDTVDPDFGELTAIQSLTIAGIAAWPDLDIKADSPRQGQELNWFQLTGQVRLVKAEDDGDLHIQLSPVPDRWGRLESDIQIVTEVPLGDATGNNDEPWSDIRREVFSWADVTFPCKPHKLKLKKHPIIRVTGKAFFDGVHKGKIPNRRSYDSNVTVWEIHPIMKLEVIDVPNLQ